MTRYYMILLRKYGYHCDCVREGKYATCGHVSDKPLDEWDLWTPINNSGHPAVYSKPPVRQSITAATIRGSICTQRGHSDDKGNYIKPVYTKLSKRDHRVVYFDTEDLLDFTSDHELAYQQREAKLTRTGELTEEARVLAANPPPAVVPEVPVKKKRKSRKKSNPVSSPDGWTSLLTGLGPVRTACKSCEGRGEIGYMGVFCSQCNGTGLVQA